MANVEAIEGLDDIQKVLAGLAKRMNTLEPYMREAINVVQNVTEESFENESSPDGTTWTPLKNPQNRKMLYDTGKMQESLYTQVFANSATIGFNAKSNEYPYPAVHQFGTTDGKVPARPFLPIRADGELMDHVVKEIMEVFEEITSLN